MGFKVKPMRLMAVFAHPDDEIGVAGTLAKHARRGDAIKLIWLTYGELASHFGQMPEPEVAAIRQEHGRKVAELIGAEYAFLGLPDAGLSASRDEALKVAHEIAQWRPDVVFTWDPYDVHPDHRAAYWDVLSALKLCRIPKLVGEAHRAPVRLLHYFREDLPRPAIFIDIEETLEVAVEVFRVYQEFYGWDRGPEEFRESRARLGALAGVRYAERFQSERPLAHSYL